MIEIKNIQPGGPYNRSPFHGDKIPVKSWGYWNNDNNTLLTLDLSLQEEAAFVRSWLEWLKFKKFGCSEEQLPEQLVYWLLVDCPLSVGKPITNTGEE